MSPRLLLLQARTETDPMAAHERSCFAATLGLAEGQIETHNILHGSPDPGRLDRCDGLLIGGSGDFSVTGSEPFLHTFFDFLARTVMADGFPTFASCFGFQGLVVAGGGEVETDASRSEVGTFDLEVVEAGRDDPLMRPLAPTFRAQLGHKDHATRLPSGVVNLARSERAPYQALRVVGKPVFATQFHPELDQEANTLRYLRYWEAYGSGDKENDPVLKSMRPTPEASALLPRWMATTFDRG